MNNVPDLIVGLWIIPVIVFVIIPLVLLCAFLCVQVVSYLIVPSVRHGLTRAIRSEKRAHRRIHANDLRVDVSDGVNVFNGLVCDISKLGICIMGIPEKLLERVDRLAVVVDSQGETYSLHVMPKWQKSMSSGRQIGALIEYAPDGWYEFVKNQGRFAFA